MTAQRVFWGSVGVTAGLFTALYAAAGETMLAALAAGLGVVWLIVDAKVGSDFGTLFFLAFIILAVMAGANGAAIPPTLLGLSANLTAWDVSRLRVRLVVEPDPDRRALVEARHMPLLAVTITAGFVVALLPVIVRLTIPFVVISALALLALLALYFSMRNLRAEPTPPGSKDPKHSR